MRKQLWTLIATLIAIGALVACHDSTPAGPSRERAPVAFNGGLPPMSRAGDGAVHAMAVSPPLGTAGRYAALAGSTVTSTGPSSLVGDVGTFAGTSITGFPPGVLTGAKHSGDAAAGTAQGDNTTAYGDLAGQACNTVLTGTDLGGLTLSSGVYCFATSAQLTGTLTLTGSGPWVFQVGSTLTTAPNSAVVLAGGLPCRLWWQVGSSATLDTNTAFAGNILALASITLNTGASNSGGLLAQTGAVTLDSNNVSKVGSCLAPGTPKPTPKPNPNPTPKPKPPPHHVPALPGAGYALLVLLMVLVGLWKRGQ